MTTQTSDPSSTFPLGAYTDELVEQLRALVPQALNDCDAQAIHHARVSTRRLKAAIDLMQPVLPKQRRKPFERVLRSLRRRLGPLRDLDVMIDHLAAYRDEPRQGPAARWLTDQLESQRQQARAHAKSAPSPAKVLARLGTWWGVRHELSEAEQAVDALLGESLHQQIEQFSSQAQGLRRMNQGGKGFQDPHELRITGKALRYTLEMAAEHGHPLPATIGKSFKRMQDSLGLWHDYVVLSETAVRVWLDAMLPLHDAAMGAKVLDLARAMLRAAEEHLAKFQRQWATAGPKITPVIREMFPIGNAVETPPTPPADVSPLADTSPPADASQD